MYAKSFVIYTLTVAAIYTAQKRSNFNGSPPYLNLVILPDGHGPDPVLGSQLLGQGRGHQPPPDVRGRGEVTLPRLGAVRGHVFV